MHPSTTPAALAPMAIIIMGVSGSGKSTLGHALAQTLGCPFLEGDDFHDAAAIAKMSHGEALTDDDRWPWLDRLGAAIAGAVADRGLAVAACSALRRSYRDRLITAIPAPARFVLLDNDRDELRRRIANRPRHYMPPSLLESQLQTLERPSAGERAMAFDAGAAPEVLCRRVLAWLDQPGADR